MSEQQTISKEAAVAAKWWADQLRTGFEPNNGSADEEGTVANTLKNNPSPFAKGLFSRTADEEQCTPERVDAFEAALAKGIQEMLAQEFQSSYGNTFGVDYHPDPILSKALAEADIKESMTTLPWKTHMNVFEGRVTVGAGYGAAWKELPCD